MRDRVRVDAAPPRRLEFGASLDGRSKLAQRLVGHIETAILRPSKCALRQAHLLDTERLAVRVPRVLLVRAAVADMRARHDQRRSILDGACGGQRRIDGRHVLPVDPLHVPAVGFEARADVLRKCEVRRRGERDQVRVVEHDQTTEPKGAGERRRFRGNPFHHVAVAGEDIGVVVHDIVAMTIEGRRQPPLRDRHADAVAEPLTERSRGDLDAGRAPALRMTGRSALPLPELLEVFHREVVAGQKQQTVEQRTGVPGREHEPVAVGPRRILRIVPQVARPQDVGHRRRAHRHAGMPGVRLLNRVDRQHPDRVDTELVLIRHPRHLALSRLFRPRIVMRRSHPAYRDRRVDRVAAETRWWCSSRCRSQSASEDISA